jgi:hypothetical protein
MLVLKTWFTNNSPSLLRRKRSESSWLRIRRGFEEEGLGWQSLYR